MSYSMLYDTDNNETHRDIKEELMFFQSAGIGDMAAIRENVKQRRFRDLNGTGTLSQDPVLNLKYHMVITAGLLTRVCIEKGLETEHAFRMSDYYIRKLDFALTEDDVEKIHDEMILDFTGKMRTIRHDQKMSRPVYQCIDYIYAHLCERITVRQLSEHTGKSTSYLSRAFSNDLGISISDFIREKKIEMAQDLLANTDKSTLEISCQMAFSSQSHFIQCFKKLIGVTPKEYRDSHRHLTWADTDRIGRKNKLPVSPG